MSNLHIIAEAGTNHGGNIETAKKLVDVATKVGADSVKFQLIYPEGLYLPELRDNGNLVPNEVFEKRKSMMLSDEEYRELHGYSIEQGLPWTCSIFDERGIDLLDDMDVPYFKIASCDLNNYRLLKQAAERGRKLIVSTGMASLGEIEDAVEAIVSTGNQDLVLLHCVSIYPCPVEKANLAFIDALRVNFGFDVGFSDHTESSVAAAVAVSKGATWFEKHYTLDRSADGFDHSYAMEPDMMAQYIGDLRATFAALSADKKVSTTEASVKVRARRSLYAARDLEAGERLEKEDILIVRPEGALAPGDIKLVSGKVLTKPIKRYEALELRHFFQ